MAMTQRHTASAFDGVADLFASYDSADRTPEGYEAQLAVYVGGELVVDLSAGISPDALMTVFSSSKGLAAFGLGLLVDRGQLDLDAPVAAYWPEFAQAGKSAITVRQLLSHQAGLPTTDRPITYDEWLDPHAAAEVLAAQRPLWHPGSAFGYHAISIGTLIGELVFRITGDTIQEFYEREVRVPVGADAYLGLPDALEDRVVELLPLADPTPEELTEFAAELSVPRGPYGPPTFAVDFGVLMSQRARAFGHAAGGGVCSARGLAAVYDWATGYGRGSGAVTADTLDAFAQSQVAGYDMVLDQPRRSHGIVFQKPTGVMPFGSYRAFGHDGAAGAMAFADPATGICLGYTIRRGPFPGGIDRRVFALAEAVRAAIA
ncbi:serine hydrolase domain-containing protein [Naasia lichenicola]|uniref:Beta-lactamase family protein n=1 Tax=Naasia lichenicola TaxID=2565933 RepID=A0A4S4FH55_9MICO|nr:serine hydrolase domain-containing protein [Naasia lichenicola]THG29630.1 beta-lactamase family protein [Naasia lichenicola]